MLPHDSQQGSCAVTGTVRVQLVGDKALIDELESAAPKLAISTERREPPGAGQNFGMVELAAIVVVAKGVAELAKMIVGVWKDTKHKSKVTITTPKGSITVESDSKRTVDELLMELQPVIA